MNLMLSHCFVTVDNPEKAVAFYRDVLGLQIVNDFSFDEMRWLTVRPPSQPGVEIVLVISAQDPATWSADSEAGPGDERLAVPTSGDDSTDDDLCMACIRALGDGQWRAFHGDDQDSGVAMTQWRCDQ